ncbi:FAD-dependent oxidoreductase [Nocardioides pocheonensis]|uniref:NAD(P)/FAD-dependent oxidoreductase n=1 Tax=Nocardioides pocheonensis TaxID=661485 RepID=A0A3N0GIA3_9ACTN|nr:FAD-dependent oxidoreductase [Nocardioides pocheonensis]RNM12205.1 NAD(P)/FAD-dependent oxidoreductase [Nocardioides pocheonensis]
MQLNNVTLGIAEWRDLIRRVEIGEVREPLVNIDDSDAAPWDAIFVGGGAAGRFGAAYLKAMGGRPLVVDRWPFLGGSCPHQACVPHHLFSEAARELDYMRWNSGTLWFPKFDDSTASILDLISLFRSGRAAAHAFMNWQTKEQLGVEYVLNAEATVIDCHTVNVADGSYTARNLVLATGAQTAHPRIPGIRKRGVFDFASLIEDLDYEPTKCVIVGGSKVAMEYGSFFQATGCQTTILSRSPLMRGTSLHHVDEDLRIFVVSGMRARGLTVHEDSATLEILGDEHVEGVRARLADGAEIVLDTDFVLLATGELPATAELVRTLGIELDEHGFVEVDTQMRTSVAGVYAVGDLIGSPLEMFKARKCGMTAARNIMGEPYTLDLSQYPDFLHTTYEVTWVGLTEQEAREKYGEIIVIQMPPNGLDQPIPLPLAEGSMLYAFTRPEITGYQKAVFDARSRRLVGAHHVGFGAKDAFQYLDHLIKRGITIDELGEMNELFLNPEHFIQLSRLRAGQHALHDL